MTDQAPIIMPHVQKYPPIDHLPAAAQAAVSEWQLMHQTSSKGGFTRRVEAARDALDTLIAELEHYESKPTIVADPLLEIRENPRLLRAVVLEAYSIRRKAERLPCVVLPNQGEQTRAAALAAAYLDAADSVWTADGFRICMDAAQQNDPLELRELWALPTMLKFLLLEWILTQASARLHAPSSTAAGSAAVLRARDRKSV